MSVAIKTFQRRTRPTLTSWRLYVKQNTLCPPPQNFSTMQLSELEDNIVARRNRIFLLMEEVRRLRIQRRLKVRCRTRSQVPAIHCSSERDATTLRGATPGVEGALTWLRSVLPLLVAMSSRSGISTRRASTSC